MEDDAAGGAGAVGDSGTCAFLFLFSLAFLIASAFLAACARMSESMPPSRASLDSPNRSMSSSSSAAFFFSCWARAPPISATALRDFGAARGLPGSVPSSSSSSSSSKL